jgi:hypothetical protein
LAWAILPSGIGVVANQEIGGRGLQQDGSSARSLNRSGGAVLNVEIKPRWGAAELRPYQDDALSSA